MQARLSQKDAKVFNKNRYIADAYEASRASIVIVDDYEGGPVTFSPIYMFGETYEWLAFCRTKCNFFDRPHQEA